MKTVIFDFSQPGSRDIWSLEVPDDMDVDAEIAECRTRSSRQSFRREERSRTVFRWFLSRGCNVTYLDLINGWHEPPMTRPRSENCNVPLVTPYIRICDTPGDSERDDWVAAASRQIGCQDSPDTYADAFSMADNRPVGSRPRFPGELTQEECVARAIRRPANRGEISIAGSQIPYETVENTTEVTLTDGRPVEWRPPVGSGWTASIGQMNSMLQWIPTAIRPEVFDEEIFADEMRELGRRAARISEARAAALSQPPATRDQDNF